MSAVETLTPKPPSTPLVLGFTVLREIPPAFRLLADDIVACYRRCHRGLRSVYVIGSVATGEWKQGISDIDVVGVTDEGISPDEEAERRSALTELGTHWPIVSFINNSAFSLSALHTEHPDAMVLGRARIIAVTGLHLWGDAINFQEYFPSAETMAYGRAARARILMQRYRSGLANEPFRSEPRLLARSAAKAAIRVLSGITILRGATFYTSSGQTVMAVLTYAPEATALAARALAIVDGADANPGEAIDVADQSVELFYRLFPDHVHNA